MSVISIPETHPKWFIGKMLFINLEVNSKHFPPADGENADRQKGRKKQIP